MTLFPNIYLQQSRHIYGTGQCIICFKHCSNSIELMNKYVQMSSGFNITSMINRDFQTFTITAEKYTPSTIKLNFPVYAPVTLGVIRLVSGTTSSSPSRPPAVSKQPQPLPSSPRPCQQQLSSQPQPPPTAYSLVHPVGESLLLHNQEEKTQCQASLRATHRAFHIASHIGQ